MGTLAVNADLVGLLQSRFGHAGFRRGQRELVEAAAGGRDTLAILPTGAGKSLCYQIMPLVRPGLTIVITPPGTFVHEQMSMLNRIGIAADTLSAGQSFCQQRAVVERVESGEVRVLYLGAETVSGHSASLFPWLSGLPVGLVAVDEAHCVTEWGYQFCPDYRVLGVLRESLDAPFMAVTSAATPECKDDIIKQLGLRDPLVQIESFVRPNLRYSVLQRPSDRMGALAEVVSGHEGRGPAVVYCESRDEVVELARLLRAEGLEARAYHEGMEGEERLRREIDFYKGQDQCDGCDQGLWNGDRQVECEARAALSDTLIHRAILSGVGSSRPRRKGCGLCAVRRLSRPAQSRTRNVPDTGRVRRGHEMEGGCDGAGGRNSWLCGRRWVPPGGTRQLLR